MMFLRSVASLALILALRVPGAAQAQAPKQPSSFDRLSKLADTERQQNHLDNAIGYYRQALKVRTSWKDGWWYLGTILYDQDHYAEARDAFQRAVEAARTSPPHRRRFTAGWGRQAKTELRSLS